MTWPCWWVDLSGPCGVQVLSQAPTPAVLVPASVTRATLTSSPLDWFFGKPGAPKEGLSVWLLLVVSVLILSWVWSYFLACQKAQDAADRRRALAVERDAYDGGPMTALERLQSDQDYADLQRELKRG